MAGASTIKKTNRINIKNVVYAKCIKDDISGVQYSEIKPLAKAMQVQISPGLAKGVLYGDGVKQEVISKLTGLTLTLDSNKIPIDVRADIQGNKYENGVLVENADDQAPDIAIGYMVEQTEKTAEYIWLLKGKSQPMGSNVQQTTENINFSTDALIVEFVPREFDGDVRHFADSADSTFTSEMAAQWFTKVPGTVA